MKPGINDILKELAGTHYGAAMREFLAARCADIGDVTKATSWDDVLGRKIALKVLKELFTFIDLKQGVDNSRERFD